jgi:oligopeptide/dipeptide ABC transporter ATP-binding protein
MLRVSQLRVRYRTKEATTYAVEDVSLELKPGRVLALVGESGAGKTTVGMSILKLLPQEAEILGGSVTFDGLDLLGLKDDELRRIRGRRIAMIFQDPIAGLNPVIPVGDQVAETVQSHLRISKKQSRNEAIRILAEVGLADPERTARSYPFQLSGGMCQRVMIGMATALDPEVLIADEPTSALDVTVQAQILRQLNELRHERGTAILLITHNFGVVAQMADDVAVMYAGRIAETGAAEQVFKQPLHPYSHALMATLPRFDRMQEQLHAIPGTLPELSAPAERCPFLPRCIKAVNLCRHQGPPALESYVPGRLVACYNPVWQG